MAKSKRHAKQQKTGNHSQAEHVQTTNKIEIESKQDYEVTMKEIEGLMKRGEANLSPSELIYLRTLAEAAEVYEDNSGLLALPSTLPEIIKMKMLQLKPNQQFTAQLLGVSKAKFSLIMNGKQKPDVYFLKAVHEKLKVDAHLLLETV